MQNRSLISHFSHSQGGMHLFQTIFWSFCLGEVNTPVALLSASLGGNVHRLFLH